MAAALMNHHFEDFKEAVTELIANSRSAPMLNDIEKQVLAARQRRAEALRLKAEAPTSRVNEDGNLDVMDIVKACAQAVDMRAVKFRNDAHKAEVTAKFDQALGLLKQVTYRGCDCTDGYITQQVNGYSYLRRCSCAHGRALPPEIFSGERGIFIPIVTRDS